MIELVLVWPPSIAKAAMSEQLARSGRPGRGLRRLYARWAQGGAGMLLSFVAWSFISERSKR